MREGSSEELASYAGVFRCVDNHPAAEIFRERMLRDEEIKRRTGQVTQDQDYDDWRSGRWYGGTAGLWDLDDEEIEFLERQTAQAAAREGHQDAPQAVEQP